MSVTKRSAKVLLLPLDTEITLADFDDTRWCITTSDFSERCQPVVVAKKAKKVGCRYYG